MNSDSHNQADQLPVRVWRDPILQSVDHNQVTIITAETGAGKSTQVPQYLAAHGYDKVIVTQPRILAARNLCARVRDEYTTYTGSDATNLVGYRTAAEQEDSPENKILFCTDGLQLVRELTGSGTGAREVLILDEVHEWNENMEVLVAWSKQRVTSDPHFRLVLMSATINAETLAAYFDAPTPITIPGNTYEVIKRIGQDVVTEILDEVTRRVSNIMVFLPGKAEIEQVATTLRSQLTRPVPVIILHGQLESSLQQRAFDHYPNGKIILTTNVAQTSITIDDIDVVIDSGLERRAEVRNGVEGLFIASISRADCLQRAGRAGRTKPGEYVLAQLGKLPCPPLEERAEYGTPEIMRKHIDRVVLRLASIGIDIENLDFYHSPSRKTIQLAKRTLITLGALTKSGEVTTIGRQMERFPVESSYARMIVESTSYNETIQIQLAAIIAIQEVGGIVKTNPRYTGWRRLTHQTSSDLLAQYEVLTGIENVDELSFEDFGVIPRNVAKAQDVRDRLTRDLGNPTAELAPINTGDIEPLLKCIVAGQLHQLWSLDQGGVAVNVATKKKRRLGNGTVVKHAKLVAGRPFDLEIASPKGLDVLHLVTDITAVNPLWLSDLSPDTYKVAPGKLYYDPDYGTLATRTTIRTNGHAVASGSTPMLVQSEENETLFNQYYSSWLLGILNAQRKKLAMVTSRKVPAITIEAVQHQVQMVTGGIISLAELSRAQQIALTKLAQLETFLGDAYRPTPAMATPGAPPRKHRARNSPWKPPHQRGRKSGRG